MDTIFSFLLIVAIFLFSLLLKRILKAGRWCAMCMAVSGTWIILLTLQYLKKFYNPLLIALLVGQSIIGVMYLLEKKLSEKWQLFRLPFLLSMTFVGYVLLAGNTVSQNKEIIVTETVITMLWIIFGIIFAYRNSPRFNAFAKSVIECCKGW